MIFVTFIKYLDDLIKPKLLDFDVGSGDEVSHSELPALEQLVKMGYIYKSQADLNKERNKLTEVILYDRLKNAIRKINPHIDDDGIDDALKQIHEDNYKFAWNTMDVNEKIRAKLVGLSQSGGLEPITVDQYDETGAVKKTVNLFDFENIANNDFLVTNQFELQGFKSRIYPDIVLFVNGIPLVIIECKSPSRIRWLEDAVEKENFKKYRSKNNGFDRLMYYNHILVATCGMQARHGTISSDTNNFQNSRWSSAYPLTLEQVEEEFGRSREQEILIAGLLSHHTLLDHLKNYVVYQTTNNKKIKITAKHQQYRAVTKCIQKLKTVKDRHGGVVWHTQGSGKSFTMLWLAKQAMSFGNLPLLIITDRLQLTQQIHNTFLQSGYPAPIKAKHSSDLDDFIKSPQGKTMMTTIQKFDETRNITDKKIIVMVDEAHRSQYGLDANAMSAAIPNGVFFGFTGTPIDKEDKSTFQVFGDLIDDYGFEESKADGATIPIDYTGRLPNLFVEDESIDELFERVIGSEPGMNAELKEKLKKQYVTKGAIAEAPARIKKIALDITKHYTENYLNDGYKAMVVASSREAAVLYKKELDRLNAPPSKIIMDQKPDEVGKDGTNWDEFYLTNSQQRQLEESFKDPKDPLKIFIVVDMLLVGFDAPIIGVMYLDKSLKEHALLQAIARVNRPLDEHKIRGLVVDYYGITKNLQKSLEYLQPDQIKGVLEHDDQKLGLLHSYYQDVMNHIDGFDKKDYEQLVEYFEPADKRDSFEEHFKRFAKLLNTQIHKKETRPYVDDFKDLCKIRQVLRNSYENPQTSTRKFAPQIQQIIDDAIRASGVKTIFSSMEITFENFLAYVSKFETARARTALIKNKAEQVIQENMQHNPAYFEDLRQKLLRLISEENQRRKDNAKYFNPDYENKYKDIYEQAMSEYKVLRDLGLGNRIEFAIYGFINHYFDENNQSKEITKILYAKLFRLTEIVEFQNNPSVQRQMKEIIYDTLDTSGIADEKIHEATEKILILINHEIV